MPATTPGMAAGRGSAGRGRPAASGTSGTTSCPSASANARLTTSWTSDCSRNRTSALVGWTLTSTRSGGSSTNRCTSGLRGFTVARL